MLYESIMCVCVCVCAHAYLCVCICGYRQRSLHKNKIHKISYTNLLRLCSCVTLHIINSTPTKQQEGFHLFLLFYTHCCNTI